MKSRMSLACLLAVLFIVQSFDVALSMSNLITATHVKKSDFSPISGERVQIYFSLARSARVTLKIFDSDNNLVAVPVENRESSYGLNTAYWDGRNSDGEIVPDTTFYFTIDAVDVSNHAEKYNPVAFSGGKVVQVQLIDSGKRIAYEIPVDAMVRIRIGIHNGPLLKTLVDWAPRRAGEHYEAWNGMDDSGIIDVRSGEYSLDIQAYSLVENSLITHGSGIGLSESILGDVGTALPGMQKVMMKREARKRLLVKEPVEGEVGKSDLYSHYTMTKARDKAPRFTVNISSQAGTENTLNTASALRLMKTAVRSTSSVSTPNVVNGVISMSIDLEELSGLLLANTRYEVIIYVDNEFYSEDEQGYHPYSFQLDTIDLANGNHTVTFNIATLTDQVGSGSINIFVQN